MPYNDFYYETIKLILDQAIDSYSRRLAVPIANIDAQIAHHIQDTSVEHRNPDPNINYNDPLCRLGYLFSHAGANAHLFEQAIEDSHLLSELLHARSGLSLSLCTIGGGPGTEVLGLTKYFLVRGSTPIDVSFSVIDSVNQWGESWNLLAQAAQNALRSAALAQCPIIHQGFYAMDATNAQSYQDFAWLFENVDLFVLNYLLSENQVRLADFEQALVTMLQRMKSGGLVLVIDRWERGTPFRQNIIDLFIRVGLNVLEQGGISGSMPDDYDALGDYINRFDRHPRKWFRTSQSRYPTVFWFVAQKPAEVTIEF